MSEMGIYSVVLDGRSLFPGRGRLGPSAWGALLIGCGPRWSSSLLVWSHSAQVHTIMPLSPRSTMGGSCVKKSVT